MINTFFNIRIFGFKFWHKDAIEMGLKNWTKVLITCTNGILGCLFQMDVTLKIKSV